MAAQEIIANLAAQVRRLMAEHAKLRGLCDRMKTEGDALRKENRTLQERVRLRKNRHIQSSSIQPFIYFQF